MALTSHCISFQLMHTCPGFWRFWLCLNIVYVLILIFALFQVSSVDLRRVVEAGVLRTVQPC